MAIHAKHLPAKERQAVMAWVSNRLLNRIDNAADGFESSLAAMKAIFMTHIDFVVKYLGAPRTLLPAFAVGRTQEILFHLHSQTRQGRLHVLKIFVDSPMATEITKKHFELFDEQARDLVEWHDEATDLPYLHFTASVDEPKALNQIRSSAITISASGMCNAERIRHHLRNNLARPQCSVLISGYQAEGTLGRQLVNGATTVRIFDDEIPVNVSIHILNGFSTHADQAALLDWTSYFKTAPKQASVLHGEAKAAEEFSGPLKNSYGWKILAPEHGKTVEWNAQAQRLEP